jgi:hypothetical protein
MRSIIRLVSAAIATSIVGMSLPSLAVADDTMEAERARPAVSQTVGIAPASRAEVVRGVVASVDERNDTIKIQQSPAMAEELKVQDGLLFSAVRYGDEVEVTVQNINGAKTIVGLMRR